MARAFPISIMHNELTDRCIQTFFYAGRSANIYQVYCRTLFQFDYLSLDISEDYRFPMQIVSKLFVYNPF